LHTRLCRPRSLIGARDSGSEEGRDEIAIAQVPGLQPPPQGAEGPRPAARQARRARLRRPGSALRPPRFPLSPDPFALGRGAAVVVRLRAKNGSRGLVAGSRFPPRAYLATRVDRGGVVPASRGDCLEPNDLSSSLIRSTVETELWRDGYLSLVYLLVVIILSFSFTIGGIFNRLCEINSKLLIGNLYYIIREMHGFDCFYAVIVWTLEFRSIWVFVPCFLLVKVHGWKLGAIRTGLAVSNSKSLLRGTDAYFNLPLGVCCWEFLYSTSVSKHVFEIQECSSCHSIFHLIYNVYTSCPADALCILTEKSWSKLFGYGRY
jgi:hypothetical protein